MKKPETQEVQVVAESHVLHLESHTMHKLEVRSGKNPSLQ